MTCGRGRPCERRPPGRARGLPCLLLAALAVSGRGASGWGSRPQAHRLSGAARIPRTPPCAHAQTCARSVGAAAGARAGPRLLGLGQALGPPSSVCRALRGVWGSDRGGGGRGRGRAAVGDTLERIWGKEVCGAGFAQNARCSRRSGRSRLCGPTSKVVKVASLYGPTMPTEQHSSKYLKGRVRLSAAFASARRDFALAAHSSWRCSEMSGVVV